MSVKVVFFASIREALGRDSALVPASAGLSLATLLEALAQELGEGCRAALTAEHVRVAVNQELAHGDLALKDGDEVAYLPPVTGG